LGEEIGVLRVSKQHRDEGFGLVEIMVSMLIITILMLSMLSVIISALRVNVGNATKATAVELSTQRLEEARQASVTGDCANVRSVVEKVVNTTDGRGAPLKVTGVLACAAQTPGDEHNEPRLARVTVTVTTTVPGFPDPLVQTATDIYVKFNPS
jgi:type II secretory pathway pseudopilin PulG